ncbi:glutathione S-transferase family protein [Hyalangium rubrum]|uniref:Glutathione S-transferase family protein n=1 Tax=Hyalangium rubrum TaxID=3103134 RepID=A0ABU5HG67_9BACT|nr:glutathione S-transferase family protein [Hyalangium sp. s54d21]MDY7232457.1 glutathione S-transferase family protein [Hyalangium sp. s54d21]
MLRLVQIEGAWGLPNISPACMKLETWLRMAGVPYTVAPLDMTQAPKGKIPYVIEEDGTLLGDSTFIIEHLKATRGVDPDAGLTAEQRAITVAFRRMLKENFYWVIIHERYKDERNWPPYREVLAERLHFLPEEQRVPAADAYRKLLVDQLQGQGLGRHTPEEVYRIGREDLGAVSDFLGAKAFFLGERPSTVDATVYAYVSSMIDMGLPSPVKDFGRSRENLVRYCQRMRERYFPELAAAARR